MVPTSPISTMRTPTPWLGGEARFAVIGTFDSLNPFLLQGTAASGIGFVYDTLDVPIGG